MKKVLFATTALVATAGVAAADVTFGGYGRFGVIYNEGTAGTPAGATAAADEQNLLNAEAALLRGQSEVVPDAATIEGLQEDVADAREAFDNSAAVAGEDDSTDVTSRFRLQIDATAESDMGVTFGARVRIEGNESVEAGGTRAAFNGVRYFARSGGLEVGVGNIYGPLEFMPGMYDIDLGLTGLGYDYTAFNFRGDAYSSGGLGAAGQNGLEVIYSMGDFKVHVSASDVNDRVAAVGSYTFSGYTFAVAVQDSDDALDTEYALSASGDFGPAFLSFAYAKNGDDNGLFGSAGGGDHYVLAARFDIGAATDMEAYIADADYFVDTSYGVDFNHDLGGGTSLRGGVASLGTGRVRADLGVRFNF